MTAMYLLTAVPATAQREGESARPRALERLAILPFNNMSGQPSDDWIGAGIAETVTADFEALGALTVIAQERVRAVAARRGEARWMATSNSSSNDTHRHTHTHTNTHTNTHTHTEVSKL